MLNSQIYQIDLFAHLDLNHSLCNVWDLLELERVLKMLEQFLISNQTLKLDETFKVYLKVLSIPHIKFNQNNPFWKKENH